MEKQTAGAAEGNETEWGEEQEREQNTQVNIQGEYFPKAIPWKMRGADFCEFLQTAGPKAWSFKRQQGWLG